MRRGTMHEGDGGEGAKWGTVRLQNVQGGEGGGAGQGRKVASRPVAARKWRRRSRPPILPAAGPPPAGGCLVVGGRRLAAVIVAWNPRVAREFMSACAWMETGVCVCVPCIRMHFLLLFLLFII